MMALHHVLLKSNLSFLGEPIGQSRLGESTTFCIVIKYPLTRYISGIVTPRTFKA